MDSPLGKLSLRATARGIVGIYMEDHCHAPAAKLVEWLPDSEHLMEARQQLSEYFAGSRTAFDLALDHEAAGGGTVFQRRVWSALADIPYGETISYGELARRIGQPSAMRAVGLANGRNPWSIVVPCHRVIGASGALTGYGGGMTRKRFLLDLEARHHRAALVLSVE